MLIWNTNRYHVEQHNSNVQLYGFTTATNEYSDLVSGGSLCFLVVVNIHC